MQLLLGGLAGMYFAGLQFAGQLAQLTGETHAFHRVAQTLRQRQVIVERPEQLVMTGATEPTHVIEVAVGEFAQVRVDAFECVRRTAPLLGLFARNAPAPLNVSGQLRGIGVSATGMLQTPQAGIGIVTAGKESMIDTPKGFVAHLIKLLGAGINGESRRE